MVVAGVAGLGEQVAPVRRLQEGKRCQDPAEEQLAHGSGVDAIETELTAEEKQRIDDLKKQDRAVKAHEQAHIAAGGDAVRGAASYQYQIGPDGQQYAVGGEVQIDVSPERSPKATIRKMEQIIQAALAPAQPSGTDRAVAARAAQVEGV